MNAREPSGPHYYTVRPVGVNGNRPHGGITTETVARRIAAHHLKCGATYVAIEHQGSTIVEYGTAPSPGDDAIGRDFAKRRFQLAVAKEELDAARRRGADPATIRRFEAEVEQLSCME